MTPEPRKPSHPLETLTVMLAAVTAEASADLAQHNRWSCDYSIPMNELRNEIELYKANRSTHND